MGDRTSTEHMKAILQCVEAGEWPASGDGDDMWLLFHDAFEGGVWSLYHARALEAFNGSLDAAKALHDAALPGWEYGYDGSIAWVKLPGLRTSYRYDARGGFTARAWLVAILKALITKGAA